MSAISGVSDSSGSYYTYGTYDQVEDGVNATDPTTSGGGQVWTQEEKDEAVQNEVDSMSQTISESNQNAKKGSENMKKSYG